MVGPILLAILLFSGVAFSASSVLYAAYLRRRKNDAGFWASVFALIGYAALTTGGVLRTVFSGRVPIGSFLDSLIVVVWLLVTLYFLVELKWKLRVGGAFVFPIAAAGALYASFRPVGAGGAPPILQGPWVGLHVGLMFLGYCSFALAALAGFLYLVQEQELKTKRLTFMHFCLPSLVRLERLSWVLVGWGFPLLTAGIASGVVWSKMVWGSYLVADPKMLWSILTWIFYAAAIVGRIAWGWRGRRAAILALVGFFAVIFNYLGISLLTQGVHRF